MVFQLKYGINEMKAVANALSFAVWADCDSEYFSQFDDYDFTEIF